MILENKEQIAKALFDHTAHTLWGGSSKRNDVRIKFKFLEIIFDYPKDLQVKCECGRIIILDDRQSQVYAKILSHPKTEIKILNRDEEENSILISIIAPIEATEGTYYHPDYNPLENS